MLTEEGYVSLNDNKYHYYLKDHQGNNRVVINQSGSVEKTHHYYPFGDIFASTNNIQPYKYNGKELDSKKGLNWYDYGARHYDAALGRWHVSDPSGEKYYQWSPYTYCLNNPMNCIDPLGTDTVAINDVNWNFFPKICILSLLRQMICYCTFDTVSYQNISKRFGYIIKIKKVWNKLYFIVQNGNQ